MANNYKFYIDGVELPINPSTLDIKIGSKNKTVDLANGGEMTILKSPALTNISFSARLPQMGLSSNQSAIPFLNRGAKTASYYIEKMKQLKVSKKVFQLLITRHLPNGMPLFKNDITVVLEDFSTKEDATEGFDVILELNFKQYIEYKTKIYTPSGGKSEGQRTEKTPNKTIYTIESGDTLWTLAKYFYGDGGLYLLIYEANKSIIESTAKARGRDSSRKGHWIFPGTVIVIPER